MPLRSIRCAIALLFVLLLGFGSTAGAQQTSEPKLDIFAGYSWASPGEVFDGTNRQGASGWDAAVAYNFNRWFALQGDFGGNYRSKHDFSHVLFGPRLGYRTDNNHLLFAEALFGLARIKPAEIETVNGFGMMLGGGFDANITDRISWRVLQADYYFQDYDERPYGLGREHGYRAQTGIVFKFGGAPVVPVSATCSITPSALMAGEPVTATVSPANFNPKRTLTYNWTATGGKVTGKNTTADIDTTGMAPGQYTVTAKVTDPRAKKNGTATCSSNFTINEPPRNPPTISCNTPNPTVRTGDPATINCQAASPDNRPLTYQWQASAGAIKGQDATATLDTTGAAAGPITVTTTVSDDRQLTAQATTTVNVEVPPPPPTTSKLNEIAFNDRRRPARVDNAAKAVLDDVALTLQRDAEAKAVIVGYFEDGERRGENIAQQRAFNAKQYLTQEKGIDPARIEVRTSSTATKRGADIFLVPAGATFNEANTATFDEATLTKRGVRRR